MEAVIDIIIKPMKTQIPSVLQRELSAETWQSNLKHSILPLIKEKLYT